MAKLRKLQAATGQPFAMSILLYDGETIAPFGDESFAVPIRTPQGSILD